MNSIAPEITGSQLVKDQTTGLLYSELEGALGNWGFSLQKKLAFIKIFDEMFPNISAACEMANVSRTTVNNHLKIDPTFRQQLYEIEVSHTDAVEHAMLTNAKKPNGFMDRIAWLRAHRPEKYTETKRIINTRELGPEALIQKKANLLNVVDAELVHDAVIIQQQDQAKRSQNPGAELSTKQNE